MVALRLDQGGVILAPPGTVVKGRAGYAWSFQQGDRVVEFEPTGPLALDDQELMIEAALAGVTLAYVWEERARPHLAGGRLLSCLADWCAPEDWLHLYYPTRRYLSAGMRVVIEALRV